MAAASRSSRTVAAVMRRLLHRADQRHWTDEGSFDDSWAGRAKLIAALVPPSSRVLELGAGHQHLKKHLDARCAYFPSDLVGRTPDTLIIDLEHRPLPDLSGYAFDVAVFAGVLEYLSDPPSVIAWIGGHVPTCIASYECAPHSASSFQRLKNSWARARVGWINSYTDAELDGVFRKAGYSLAQTTIWKAPDGDEPVFLFTKRIERQRVDL